MPRQRILKIKKRNQNGRLLKGRRLLNQKQSLQAATRQESIMVDQTKTQKLFYIADYFGNYYRLNENNELIASAGVNTAGVFTEQEVQERMGQGKKLKYYRKVPVDLPQLESSSQDTEETELQRICEKNDTRTESPSFNPACFTVDDLSQINWKEFLKNLVYINKMLPSYRDHLREAQSNLDLLILDLIHYVELYEYDDLKALNIIDQLRDARERRRIVKDELFCADRYQNLVGTSANTARVKQVLEEINQLEKRTYHPRVAGDLFKGAKKRPQRELSCYAEIDKAAPESEIETEEFYEEGTYEMTYEYERVGTIYDDCKTDWKDLVQSQIMFFRNAPQHIIDLQCDLESTDIAIEEALSAIEDASYNVAQGFKVYKELKELRNKRRQILLELNYVQTIAERFNCGAMLQIYEEIMADMILEESAPRQELTMECCLRPADNDSVKENPEENPVTAVS